MQNNAAGINLGNSFCGIHVKFNDDPPAAECSGIHIIVIQIQACAPGSCQCRGAEAQHNKNSKFQNLSQPFFHD